MVAAYKWIICKSFDTREGVLLADYLLSGGEVDYV